MRYCPNMTVSVPEVRNVQPGPWTPTVAEKRPGAGQGRKPLTGLPVNRKLGAKENNFMMNRWDETWHRLRGWTNGQGPSERLAAQILQEEGYIGLDPSHPLGGKDGGKDAICKKEDEKWVMAVYFPRGEQTFASIRDKFEGDLCGVEANGAAGIAFVTNQELRLSERQELISLAGSTGVDLFHLERITTILDKPSMGAVRKQFLSIDFSEDSGVKTIRDEIARMQCRLEGLQIGGDSYCYWMLYHFDLQKNIANNFVVIRKGEFPLHDVRMRIRDMATGQEFNRQWGEMNAPADYLMVKWPLAASVYYRVFYHARNGSWHQDLQLRRSEKGQCWLAATRVIGNRGDIRFEYTDNGHIEEFGLPNWQQ